MLDVYWSVIESESIPHISYEEPRPVLAEIAKTLPDFKNPKSRITNCPAFRDSCKNTFSLHIPIEYELEYKVNDLTTSMWDRKFFMDVVNVREPEHFRWTSLNFRYIFTAEQSLEAETLPCFLTSNPFTDNADIIPGRMDVGKWFRPIECAYVAKPGPRSIVFNQGDAYSFIRFNTEKKIRFRRFFMSPELCYQVNRNIESREYKRKLNPLSYFYNLYGRSHMHNRVMKLVKDNLMD
jgi:hypothetical protein